MTKTHLLIAALVIAHLLGTVFFGYWAEDDPTLPTAVFIGLIFSQTSLLGMWAGFGRQPVLTRCIVSSFGIVYIAFALGAGLGELDENSLYIVIVATLVVAFVCWIVRLIRAQLGNVSPDQTVRNEGLQFTIKHLFILTFAVAVLVTIGKLVTPYLRGVNETIMMTIMGVSFAAVALTSIWAMLGLGRPVVRSVFVFVIAALAGWSLAFLTGIPVNTVYLIWTLMFIMQAMFLIASLAVFRAIGFRLIAKQVETD